MEQTIAKKMGMTGVLGTQDVRAKRDLRDMKFIYVSVFVSFAAVMLIFAFLWSRLMVVNIGYEISRANSARAELVEKNKRLRLEFMKLKSPERIERLAAGDMQLARPGAEQIINIK